MHFFDQQARARRRTRLLIVLFGLAVLVAVGLAYLILSPIIYTFRNPVGGAVWWNPVQVLISLIFLLGEAIGHPIRFLKLIWDPYLACWITLGVLISVALGCFYQVRKLSDGGAAVALLLGGRRIEPGTSDLEEQRLRNIVEEMAVASQMAVPEIYVLDRECGINSFAAGHTRDDVAIGITAGGLRLLNRDELQAVIAHEFSHVLNGDTRLNMKLMALVHGLFWPTFVGRILLRGTSQSPPNGESIFGDEVSELQKLLVPPAFVFLIVGSLVTPLVRWIKSLICRERECLADASAVQFTRNPAGLQGALQKIGGLHKQGRLDTAFAESASHFYFVNCSRDPWFGFQATHPPLLKRIRALDPAFDGRFQRICPLPSHDAAYNLRYQESVQRSRAEAESRPER